MRMPSEVEAYLKRVGLDAWRTHFQTHLPANVKSVALVRATTAADLRRMGTKANMRLDNQTIQQVLNALSKKPLPLDVTREVGVPLPKTHVDTSIDDLSWDEIQWGANSVCVRGKTYRIARLQYLPRSK